MSTGFHAVMRDSNTSMKLFTSSAVYVAIVFGAGQNGSHVRSYQVL